LDALNPAVIERVIEDGIREVLDENRRAKFTALQADYQKTVGQVSEYWHEVEGFLGLVTNGHRAAYETWHRFSKADAEAVTTANPLQGLGLGPKSTIPDFHPPLPTLATPR
jgi:hypothetical protein